MRWYGHRTCCRVPSLCRGVVINGDVVRNPMLWHGHTLRYSVMINGHAARNPMLWYGHTPRYGVMINGHVAHYLYAVT